MSCPKRLVPCPLLVVLLVTVATLSAVPVHTQPTPAAGYEADVSPEFRDLIPEAQYETIVRDLGAVAGDLLEIGEIRRLAASPCGPSFAELVTAYATDSTVRSALASVVPGFVDPPVGYGMVNPWKAATSGDELLLLMLDVFGDWCVFLPRIDGDQDNGLEYIQHFAWFYYQNQAGIAFVQGRDPQNESRPLPVGREFTESFSDQRGAFLDSPASTRYVAEWIADPRIEIVDYQKQRPEDYSSWNEFFARQITVDRENRTLPSRPATMPLSEYPKRDYIVVAPTDCIMNPLVQVLLDGVEPVRQLLDNPLQYDTVLDVKGIPISLDHLLEGVPEKYRQPFVGGTGLSCVLMPNTYHHFHAPVNGTVVHAKVLDHYGTFGYADWPNWVPLDGNVGRPGTDFSQFQLFERGVVVIEVQYANAPGAEPETLTGYVASIPVGLDTIGSVVLDKDILPGKTVKRGYTRLGNFFYGGSLDILLFSKGLATGAIQTRLGNQIAVYNVGTEPDGE